MKEKRKRAPRPPHVGCLRLLLVLVIAPFAICGIGWLVLNIQLSVPFQQLSYRVQQVSNRAVPSAKESDLIAFSCSTGLYTVEPEGSNLRQIFGGYPTGLGDGPVWSSDGEWLAAALYGVGAWHLSEVFIVRFDGSIWRRLTFNHKREEHVSWTADGKAINYVVARNMYRVSADGRDSHWLKDVTSVGGGFSPVAWSPDGSWLAYELPRYVRDANTIRFVNFHGRGPDVELAVKDDVYRIVWAPDSERVALDPDDQLLVYNVMAKRIEIELTLNVSGVVWSPDGRWLALTSWERNSDERSLHLYDMGTGELRLLTVGRPHGATWSPDSEWIAYSQDMEPRQLFKMRRDGSAIQQLTDMDCDVEDTSWSPR